MQAASAPAKDKGGGGEWPPLNITPLNPAYTPLPDGLSSSSTPVTIPAA